MIEILEKLLDPLRHKILLMIGRAIIHASADKGGRLVVKMTALDSESMDDVEVFQQFGLATRPLPGCENIFASVMGQRAHSVVIATDDKRYRPQDLEPGEAAFYTDEDTQPDGHRLHLKRGQVSELTCKKFIVNAGGTVMVIDADGVTFTTPKYDIVKAGS